MKPPRRSRSASLDGRSSWPSSTWPRSWYRAAFRSSVPSSCRDSLCEWDWSAFSSRSTTGAGTLRDLRIATPTSRFSWSWHRFSTSAAIGFGVTGSGTTLSLSRSLSIATYSLENQYERLGIDGHRGSQAVRETGLARFTFPVGAPILWVPFVEAGHLGVALRNAYGLSTPFDGFSDPYFHAVALGNLLYGFLGLLVLDRLLRKWFPPGYRFSPSSGSVSGASSPST